MNSVIAAVMQLTMVRLREPAFLLLVAIAAGVGYQVSEIGPLAGEGQPDLLTRLLVAGDASQVTGGFAMILLAALLIAVFVGATDIPREIESRTVMVLLAKPITRGEYLIGKYFGVCALSLLFFFIAAGAAVIGHWLSTGASYPPALLFRQFLLAAAIFPFAAMTVMFSCFLSDLAAILASVTYLLLALFIGTIPLLLELLPGGLGFTPVLWLIYSWFPNFLHFLQPCRPGGLMLPALLVYAASTSVLLLAVAAYRLRSRDLI